MTRQVSEALDINVEERRMRWEHATIQLRMICMILGVASFGVAWHLTNIGSTGIEDVPPPFILLAGLAGLGFLCIAVIGRYPWFNV